MTVTSVVGLQWGDEAKGKIVDLLTDHHSIVVRYQGGNNAGHTVKFSGETYKLSLLPTGILRPGVTAVIGNGVVVNPEALLNEVAGLESRGIAITSQNLKVSDRAHVLFPYHVAEDGIFERSLKGNPIGTTLRGNGTCYRDKAGRSHAIRVGDLLRPSSLRARLEEIVFAKNRMLQALEPTFTPIDADQLYAATLGLAERIRPFVADTTAWLHSQVDSGASILFEGAQGSLLDIDHGTFPYVTSSNSSAAGIHSGSGISPRLIDNMIGIVKAYTTRVGGGPFPTELQDSTGERIREVGREYGTVTGRPRRCGWFDGVATRYSAQVCGVDQIAVMLLDVLSGLPEVNVCESYEIDGEHTKQFPSHVDDLSAARPDLRAIPGWEEDITGVRRLTDLPKNARRYVATIEEIVGIPVKYVSVGPDREQTIVV